MKLRTHILIVVGFALLILLMVTLRSTPQVAARVTDSLPPVAPLPESQKRREMVEAQQETEARIRELRRLEAEVQSRNPSVAAVQAAHEQVQTKYNARWTSFISTNRPTFEALRAKAAHAPNHQAHCTLCDGKGQLSFCVICPEHPGKCSTCNGSGKNLDNSRCASCNGSGKCYLCYGTGRMPCAFCDDGIIDAKSPGPPNLLPVR